MRSVSVVKLSPKTLQTVVRAFARTDNKYDVYSKSLG